MTRPIKIFALLLLTTCILPVAVRAADFGPATVARILSPDNRPCTFFMLNGLPTQWFGVNPLTPGYKEMVSILLLAQSTSRYVTVTSFSAADQNRYDPSNACGVTQVIRIGVE